VPISSPDIALLISLIQLYYIFVREAAGWENPLNIESLKLYLIKFLGYYLISPTKDNVALFFAIGLGCYLIACLYFLLRQWDSKSNRVLVLLYLLFPVATVMIIARMPIAAIHPTLAGPRYFFLPYVLLSWILLSAPIQGKIFNKIGLVFLFIALLNGTSDFIRLQDRLYWKSAVQEYRSKGKAEFPVHLDGKSENRWSFTLP
jgi:hypothetical protein